MDSTFAILDFLPGRKMSPQSLSRRFLSHRYQQNGTLPAQANRLSPTILSSAPGMITAFRPSRSENARVKLLGREVLFVLRLPETGERPIGPLWPTLCYYIWIISKRVGVILKVQGAKDSWIQVKYFIIPMVFISNEASFVFRIWLLASYIHLHVISAD